jgi:hypothetical protein
MTRASSHTWSTAVQIAGDGPGRVSYSAQLGGCSQLLTALRP